MMDRRESHIVLITRDERLLNEGKEASKIVQCYNGRPVQVDQLVVREIRKENLPVDAVFFILCDMRVEKEALFFYEWLKFQPRLFFGQPDFIFETYIHSFASPYVASQRYAPKILLMITEFDLSRDVAIFITSLWYRVIDYEYSKLRLYNRNMPDCSMICDEYELMSTEVEIYSDLSSWNEYNKLFM
jgi:hypothetical protein